jgi:pimeloyl-ACP methyl ester carboxylesterase
MTMRKAYCDGPYGQLHMRIVGEGDPLLLLHQSPLNGGQFDAVLPLLAQQGFCAVALDTPGFGASTRPAEPVGISGYAAALPAVFEAMAWTDACLLGHHTGAMTAAHFAAQNPAQIRKLILNGVPLLSDEDQAHFAHFRFEPLVPKEDGSHLLAAWNQRLTASPGWNDIRAMHRYVVDLLANPDAYGWGFEAAFAHDMVPDLMAITAPTLILTNSGEDLYAASQRARDLRPDFAFAALEGGTHDIIDEQPRAWARAVVDFLNG